MSFGSAPDTSGQTTANAYLDQANKELAEQQKQLAMQQKLATNVNAAKQFDLQQQQQQALKAVNSNSLLDITPAQIYKAPQ